MSYQGTIRAEAEAAGVEVAPHHVEAWMRLEYGTLDARPLSDFRRSVVFTAEIDRTHPGESEALATRYGITPEEET